jgi:hypothetical protein
VSRQGDKAKVRIKGAADGHYRDRVVSISQLSHLESVDEKGLSRNIGGAAIGDGCEAGQAATV